MMGSRRRGHSRPSPSMSNCLGSLQCYRSEFIGMSYKNTRKTLKFTDGIWCLLHKSGMTQEVHCIAVHEPKFS